MSDKITVEELLDKLELIVNDSHGVDGFHLNGDIATWDELEVPSILQSIREALEKPKVSREQLSFLAMIPFVDDLEKALRDMGIEVSDES